MAAFAFLVIRGDGIGMALAFSGYLITLLGCIWNILAFRAARPLMANPDLKKAAKRIRDVASVPVMMIGAFVLFALYKSLTLP